MLDIRRGVLIWKEMRKLLTVLLCAAACAATAADRRAPGLRMMGVFAKAEPPAPRSLSFTGFRPCDPGMAGNQQTIEEVGVEDAGGGRRGKCQREHDILTFGRGPSEQIVEIGGAVVDVRENVINCIRIVVICHKASSKNLGTGGEFINN